MTSAGATRAVAAVFDSARVPSLEERIVLFRGAISPLGLTPRALPELLGDDRLLLIGRKFEDGWEPHNWELADQVPGGRKCSACHRECPRMLFVYLYCGPPRLLWVQLGESCARNARRRIEGIKNEASKRGIEEDALKHGLGVSGVDGGAEQGLRRSRARVIQPEIAVLALFTAMRCGPERAVAIARALEERRAGDEQPKEEELLHTLGLVDLVRSPEAPDTRLGRLVSLMEGPISAAELQELAHSFEQTRKGFRDWASKRPFDRRGADLNLLALFFKRGDYSRDVLAWSPIGHWLRCQGTPLRRLDRHQVIRIRGRISDYQRLEGGVVRTVVAGATVEPWDPTPTATMIGNQARQG